MGDLSKDIQSTFPNNKVKALINIKYTASFLQSQEIEFFKPFGISPQQYNILRILGGAKEPMKAQTIKERMIDRAPNATRLMDKLYDKKLIERVRCTHDRRVVYIHISEHGFGLLKEIKSFTKIDFLENLTEREALELSNLLDKIR